MATTQNTVTQDPLGLKRFALTESAYDLVNSLIGIYSCLRHKESNYDEPDTVRIANWRHRIHELQTISGNGKWADLFFLEQLIAELAIEYRQAINEEEERSKHATENQPRTVHS